MYVLVGRMGIADPVPSNIDVRGGYAVASALELSVTAQETFFMTPAIRGMSTWYGDKAARAIVAWTNSTPPVVSK